MINDQRKQKKTARIRYQRLMIYSFLLILVFMYIYAKIKLGQTDEPDDKAQTTAVMEENQTMRSTEDADEAKLRQTTAQGGQENSLYLESQDMWSLALTNEHYPVPEGYPATLVEVDESGMFFDSRAADALEQMLEEARRQGLTPVICSAYRTHEEQKTLFDNEMKRHTDSGKTEAEARALTKRILSVPGSGEHCMGLAVDIYSSVYSQLDEGFEDTEEGKWLRRYAPEYGFILRYDRGKESFTGIDYEPWHFRYVGVKAAKYLTEKGICLEEFYVEESLYGSVKQNILCKNTK